MSSEKALVIVESPAKCKKIAGFLGPGYQVLATMGHIRALEEDLDAVGLDRDFEPRFRFLSEKSKATKPILEAAKGVDIIYLAADDDREGEAIAYSVACLLKKNPLTLPRAVFHEITSKAVREAIAHPRKIDMNRVFAQQARSVLDMMVGFTISPLLWKHVARGLSAGRCQTPALRLVSDREKAITNYSSTTTWGLQGEFEVNEKTFVAKMEDELEDQESAMNYMENVHSLSEAIVSNVQQKPWMLNPPKPLITSTLQQEASALYGLNPKSVMKIAQTLYEAGHITYMRTDHAILSEEAITDAHKWIREHHGEAYVGTAAHCRGGGAPPKEKEKAKGKSSSNAAPEMPQAQEAHEFSPAKREKTSGASSTNAQEAHECIRPTHMEVQDIPGEWTASDRKVYGLIWRRAVQATMTPARGQVRTVKLHLVADTDSFDWSSQWKQTEFQGWQILGSTAKLDDSDCEADSEAEATSTWKFAQTLQPGVKLTWNTLQAAPKSTKPQPRFTEATLIRELEHKGIGRPSTYASLVETLFEKSYVEKKDSPGSKQIQTSLLLKPSIWPPETVSKQINVGAEKGKLIPTALGESVLRFALREFPQLFAYEFTAQMESRLDAVAKGDEEWKDVCRDTWASYKEKYAALNDKASAPSASEKVKDFGGGFKAVMSKTGPILLQEPQTNSKNDKPKFYPFPKGFDILSITEEAAREHVKGLEADGLLGHWEGKPILKKSGKYGEYITCGDINIPYNSSETLEQIYAKLRIKKENAPTAVGGYRFAVGPYGPYMWKDGLKTKVFVGIPSTVDPTTLTLAEAEALYKQCSEAKKAAGGGAPPKGGGRGGFRGGRGGRGGFRGGRGGHS